MKLLKTDEIDGAHATEPLDFTYNNCSVGQYNERYINPDLPYGTGRIQFVQAYRMDNFMRRFTLPGKVSHWSFRRVRPKLTKIEAKVVSHSRRKTFRCAGVVVSGELFSDPLERFNCLAAAPI